MARRVGIQIATFAIDKITFTKHNLIMKALGYISAFLGGALAGAAAGLLLAPEKGQDTRSKIQSTVEDFCKKHDIKLNRKDTDDLVDDLKDAVDPTLA